MNTDIKQNYEVIVVGLDLTEMDDHIVEYLDILIKTLPLKRVFFVHVAKELELPEEITKQYPYLLAPLDENIADGIKHKVEHLFEGNSIEYDIIVQEGPPLETFLRISKIKNADLVVLGRKRSLKGSGLLSGHIVRKSPSSILLVTEKFNPAINNILIPLDFSKHSVLALDLGLRLKEYAGVNIHFSHIYSVPIGYHKSGKSYEEFAEIMKGHATNDLNRFLKENEVEGDFPCQYILSDHDNKGKLINKNAHESTMDLILIGSRGRTRTSALLIGSIVEKVLVLDSDIPILIVKNKGENMGFFEAIMNL